MNVENIKSVYLIGIGGIGMSALARYFNQQNISVSGYDKTETPLTIQLKNEGITIRYSEDINSLNKNIDLVVYTPAIPSNHTELNWYMQNNFNVLKRSDVLQYISNDMYSICIAGTHGKTTLSTLIAHILRHSSYGCNAFLGGVSANYNVNYWSSENKTAVIEADEYDKSFLKLFPNIGVVTAMDADHLDIYGTIEEMEKCYLTFISQIKNTLIYKHGLKHTKLFNAPEKYSYSLQNDASHYYASDIMITKGGYQFDFNKQSEKLGQIYLPIGGMHNVENCVAAIAVADLLKIDFNKIQYAIEDFIGVKRRFEYIINTKNLIFIDDYAHHPAELKMLLQSAKSLFPNRKIKVVFQPHLFSRTRDFAQEFAEVLDMANEAVLLDIYPARELPIEGVTSEMILNKMTLNNKHILSKESVMDWAKHSDIEVLITAGAGDIDQLITNLKTILQNKIV